MGANDDGPPSTQSTEILSFGFVHMFWSVRELTQTKLRVSWCHFPPEASRSRQESRPKTIFLKSKIVHSSDLIVKSRVSFAFLPVNPRKCPPQESMLVRYS